MSKDYWSLRCANLFAALSKSRRRFRNRKSTLSAATAQSAIRIDRLEDRRLLSASYEFGYAFGLGSTGDELSGDVATDSLGNVYLTGAFQGTVDFGGVSLTSAGSFDAVVAKYDPTGALVWARSIGGSADDRGLAVAVDSSGSVIVHGRFEGPMDLDPGAGASIVTTAGGLDAFLVKFDTSGNFLWGGTQGGTGSDAASFSSIAVDSSGDVYATGLFTSSGVDLDPGPGTFAPVVNGGGSLDVFVTKVDGDTGNLIWGQGVGGPGPDQGHAIAVDGAGSVYVTGAFHGSNVDLDPGGATSLHSSNGSSDLFVQRLASSNGALQWVRAFGGSGLDDSYDIAVDSHGNVYSAGRFETDVDFDPGAGVFVLSSTGASDGYVSKLNSSGDFVWAAKIGSTAHDHVTEVEIDSADNVVMGGYFANTGDFDPGPASFVLASAGNTDPFVWKLDSGGNLLDAFRMGGTDFDGPGGMTLDADDNVYMTGDFRSTADFDPDPGTTAHLTSQGSQDIFLTRLNVVDPLAVTTTSDGGAGSLRQAIINANATVGADTIYLGPGTYSLTVGGHSENSANTGDLDITDDLTIIGAGADVTVVDASALGDRVFEVFAGTTFELSGITLTGGSVVSTNGSGGAIRNDGTLLVAHCTFDNNTSGNGSGGALYNDEFSSATIVQSTFSNNQTANAGGGGAIFNNRTGAVLTITNSTFSGNHAPASAGGAIYNNADATLNLTNSTLTGNIAGNGVGGGIYADPDHLGGTLNLRNSIVALNSPNQIAGGGSLDMNVTNLLSGNPHLGPLQNNGGTTLTHELLPGSPAMDAGSLAGAPPADQRGVVRPQGPAVDIGAFEFEVPAPNAVPEITSLSVDQPMIFEGESVTLTGVFADSDAGDEHTITIDWGDGIIHTETLTIGVRAFSFVHQYPDDGISPGNNTPQDIYTIDVTVADNAGGTAASNTGPNQLELDFAFGLGSTGPTWEFTNDVITDDAGNLYVAGQFTGTADFDPGPGTFLMTGSGLAEPFIAKYSSSGDLIWAKELNSSGHTHPNGANSLALDSHGHLYVGGTFHGAMDSDPGPGVVTLNTSSSLGAGFLLKLDSAGDFVWSHQLTLHSPVSSVVVDANDNLFYSFSAHRSAVIDVDPGPGVFHVTAPPGTGPMRGFAVKVNSGGTLDWVRGIGGFGQGGIHQPYLAVDGSGNLYAASSYDGTVDFDAGAGTTALSSAGGSDVAIWILDSSGHLVWAKSMGGPGNDSGFDITADSAGGVYAVGKFEGTADFDPGPAFTSLDSAGSGDGFAVHLDSAGDFMWARSFGGSSYDALKGVAVGPAGEVFTTGTFQQTVDFDPGAGTFNLTSVGATDIALWQLDSSGQFVGAVSAGGTGSDEGNKVAVDSSGDVTVGGWFRGLVDFDPAAGTSHVSSVAGNDALVWKLASVNLSPAVTVENADPVAPAQAYTTSEDSPLSLNVLSGIDDSGPFSVTDPGTLDIHTAVAGTFPTTEGGSVMIPVNGDATYTPAADFFGTDSFVYTVEDDDTGSDTATVTITVDAVNDEPAFTASTPSAINEDAGSQTISGWAAFDPGAANEFGQSVNAYTVSNVSNPGLFSAGPSVDAGGTLTFTATPDAHGTSTFDIKVQDNGGTVHGGDDTSQIQTFTITVNPVNDKPSFAAIDPPDIDQDLGVQAIANWATFDPGAFNEIGQTATYTVTSISNASLFQTLPAVDNNGTLTYASASGAFGTSTFDVQVQDNGGTANGGDDTSSVQTFTITIIQTNTAPTTSGIADIEVGEDSPDTVVDLSAAFDDAEDPDAALVFTVTSNTNPALFAATTVDGIAGTLTLDYAADTIGSADITIRATDTGHLFEETTFAVTVLSAQDQLANLIDDVLDELVANGPLNHGQGNALTTKLQNAINKINSGKINAGINQLQAFINQVNSQVPGTLTAVEAQPFIDAAHAAILAALPGSPLEALETVQATAGRISELTRKQLDGVHAVAIAYWQDAGASTGQLATLARLQIHVTDLPNQYLGFASSMEIWLDANAAGYGWWTNVTSPSADTAMSARIDLLSALVHEMGHAIGHEHFAAATHDTSNPDFYTMSPVLQPGLRTVEIAGDPNLYSTSDIVGVTWIPADRRTDSLFTDAVSTVYRAPEELDRTSGIILTEQRRYSGIDRLSPTTKSRIPVVGSIVPLTYSRTLLSDSSENALDDLFRDARAAPLLDVPAPPGDDFEERSAKPGSTLSVESPPETQNVKGLKAEPTEQSSIEDQAKKKPLLNQTATEHEEASVDGRGESDDGSPVAAVFGLFGILVSRKRGSTARQTRTEFFAGRGIRSER